MRYRVQKKSNGHSLEQQPQEGQPWERIRLYKQRDSAYAQAYLLRKKERDGNKASVGQRMISAKTFCVLT